MIRNLKVLGLALCAVFALSAVGASGASATDLFTVEGGGTATIEGTSSDNEFEITGPKVFVKCQVAEFSGSAENGASSATASPTYYGNEAEPTGEKCDSSVGKAKIDTNGCSYDLTGETTGEDEGQADATVSVTCSGEPIKITGILGCTISVPAQTPTEGGVTYTNNPDGSVTVTATATGLTYTATKACGIAGVSTHGNDSDYTGTVTVAATNGKHISVSE